MRDDIKILFVLLILWSPVKSDATFANDSSLTNQLLQRLALLQSNSDHIFSKGSFPSYRAYSLNKTIEKADENAFFTGLICFTLRDLMKDLNASDKKLALSIIDKSLPYFEHFKNQKGRATYNFWSTKPPKIFPNSGWMNLFDHSQSLPDDLDDTVILLMAMNATDSVAKEVHELMQSFVNGKGKGIKNTFDSYKNIKAYSTWFGKKMPVDFDISVLANVLYFVQHYQLKWTTSDTASLQLIESIIKDKKYVTAPASVSPHYNSTSIILYHLSRLMSIKSFPELEIYKPALISTAQRLMAQSTSYLNKTILSTALMRWGVQPGIISIETDKPFLDFIQDKDFVFFIANMSSMLPNPMKDAAGQIGIGRFNYFCEAYNTCILLENIIWQKRISSHLK